ncbi:MAG: SDR family oxidoreductase [Planctomycetota bacterium]
MTPSESPTMLITGGATGVGKACALRFAKLGFNVCINYSRSQTDAELAKSEAEALGARAVLFKCDVSDETAVTQMVEAVRTEYGRLDVLVNNAATTEFIPAVDLDSLTEEKWDRILAVNLKGPYFCTKACSSLLSAGEGGAVVNVSSVAGQTGRGSCIAYAASKGALNTMTKSFAISLAPNVRVNAVLPGPIDSRWIREGANDWDLQEMTSDFPLPRASSPDDIAEGVLFLAVGSSMATGQLLAIDGGQLL